jgi:hypothetical protein
LILLAYAHVVFQLDAKAFWWDESLSLQRAEQSLPDIVRGVLWIRDGFSSLLTIDQHPFFSFLLQGALIRTAGESEFVVRYGAVLGATLLAPALWVLARWLVRRSVAPPATPWVAVLFGAISPFMLWYGQEARPYALWAALAVLTTYLALRATENRRLDGRFAAGFVAAEAVFLTTHYYAVLLLPVHALILFAWLARRNLARALLAAAVLLVMGSLVGAYGAYTIFAQGGGQNFASLSLAMLVPDLLNAFSLGLSVDLHAVSPIPFGFLGTWRASSSVREGAQVTHDISAGFFYTARRHLVLGGEGLFTGRALLRPMIEHGVDGQLLGSAKPGRARLPPRATRRRGRGVGSLFCHRGSVVAHLSRLFGFADRYRRRLIRRSVRRRIMFRDPTWLAIDRIAAWRTRTIAGVLVQSVTRVLEIGQQALRRNR